MFAGPIYSREALTLPRQLRHYMTRSAYVGIFFVVIYTAKNTTIGIQDVADVEAMSSFGELVFQILSFVQLTLVLFFSLLFTAGNIAQEKDRQTLILLLMTDLSNREIVLGKLLASLLQVGTLILASIPVFVFLELLGGVSLSQIAWSVAVSAATGIVAGSWAAFVAFWREKTFQTLATGMLGIVVYVGCLEGIIAVSAADSVLADVAGVLSPIRAMVGIMTPMADASVDAAASVSALDSVIALLLLAGALCAVTINRLRIWNPSRTVFIQPETETAQEEGTTKQVVRHRRIWSNPVIWREMMTRAYGRRIIFLKAAYLLLAGILFFQLIVGAESSERILGVISQPGLVFAGLAVLGLVLINAQAVTSITSERDGRTLDLIVATDLTAKEFVLGKLGGVFYNTRELALVPLAISVWFVVDRSVTLEDAIYLIVGNVCLVAFAAMLGIHTGLGFGSSRQAIANSLGTIFFLFVGILVLMVLLIETRQSFAAQAQAFIVFIVAGSAALISSLTQRNPSQALRLAGLMLPFLTFYAITTWLIGGTLGVFVAVVASYGFTSLAMLIPAISEFDVALGRSTVDQG